MRIAVLRVQNLRNYAEAAFEPAYGTTVVVGDNGAGKSSLLEAAGLFSTLSSGRAGTLSVLVRDGCEEGGAKLEPTDGIPLEIHLRGGRSSMRVGGAGVAAKNFLGRFRAVLFTPEDLDLVRGEPEGRRRAIDSLLVQLRPAYRATLRDLDRALRQRNAALRMGLADEASLYDVPLAEAAAHVLQTRREAVADIAPAASELYEALAGKEELGLRYKDTSGDDGRTGADLVEFFVRRYAEGLQIDLDAGRTRVGPHRDDLEIEVDGYPAKTHASRGEQRSATLAFRLSELRLLPEAVLLLDDVLSELDPERRRRVFTATSGVQTILTATDDLPVPREANVEATWNVRGGVLTRA